jgi:hypothetical protein
MNLLGKNPVQLSCCHPSTLARPPLHCSAGYCFQIQYFTNILKSVKKNLKRFKDGIVSKSL